MAEHGVPSDREIEAVAEWFAGRMLEPREVTDADRAYAESVLSAAAAARPDFTVDELRAIKTALADTWRVDPSQSRNVADTAYAKVLALLERASLGEGSEGGRASERAAGESS